MANAVDEYWEYAGVSLHKAGWCVTTVGGSRYSVPPLRGENGNAAGVPGELWVPKSVDARTITLSMWVIGADPETGAPVDDPRLRWNDSWAYLRQVFWNPDAEAPLVRRWWRTNPVTRLAELTWAEAYAQLAPGTAPELKMTSRTRADFDVSLRLAHPFFYGPTVTTNITPFGRAVPVLNTGDYTAFSKYFYVDLIGPLTNPRVTNSTPGTPVYCGLKGSIAAGETVSLDVRNFTAVSSRAGSATTKLRSGEIYNSGTRSWMALARGANTLTLTATGGSGKAVLRFRPPYL